MARMLIVTYRPKAGHFDGVVTLLRAQYRRIVDLGIGPVQPPHLVRSAAGDLGYVAIFSDPEQIDRCWEDPDFQDLDAQLAAIAEMVPVRSLSEASGSYMDLELWETPARTAAAEHEGRAVREALS